MPQSLSPTTNHAGGHTDNRVLLMMMNGRHLCAVGVLLGIVCLVMIWQDSSLGVLLYSLMMSFIILKPLYWFQACVNVGKTGLTAVLRQVSKTGPLLRRTVQASSAHLLRVSSTLRSRRDLVEGMMMMNSADSILVPPRQYISQMTLSDVKDVFRLAVEINRPSFDRHAFLATLRPAARQVLESIEGSIVLTSRRGNSTFNVPTSAAGEEEKEDPVGEIDAHIFIAAARVFAEWRSVRLVPSGYARYSVAVELARRDLNQNIAKIESAVHCWTSQQQQQQHPTLRQLLQWEIEQNVHRQLPLLTTNSAASGLLWAKRQVGYQTSLLTNLAQIPLYFPSLKDAARASYQSTYGNYHGFWTRQLFLGSLEGVPAVEAVLHSMMAPLADEVNSRSILVDKTPLNTPSVHRSLSETTSTSSIHSAGDELNDTWVQFPIDDTDIPDSDDCDRSAVLMSDNPFVELVGNLSQEWEKFHRFLTQCSGCHSEAHPLRNAMELNPVGCHQPLMATAAASLRATDELHSYISYMQPLLARLETLIEEFDMNDPTKV